MSAPALDIFYDEGWITDVSQPVKSGKEATVYCCEATPANVCSYFRRYGLGSNPDRIAEYLWQRYLSGEL